MAKEHNMEVVETYYNKEHKITAKIIEEDRKVFSNDDTKRTGIEIL